MEVLSIWINQIDGLISITADIVSTMNCKHTVSSVVHEVDFCLCIVAYTTNLITDYKRSTHHLSITLTYISILRYIIYVVCTDSADITTMTSYLILNFSDGRKHTFTGCGLQYSATGKIDKFIVLVTPYEVILMHFQFLKLRSELCVDKFLEQVVHKCMIL